MRKTITAHCLVKNEERFVWFAAMSVIDHVDKVLLWDTGSTDGTLNVIREILKTDKGKKINFQQYGEVDKKNFANARQEMLDATKTDWFVVVDGDEIWWQDSIRHLVSEIQEKGDKIESIVVPTINLVGDIFHYQEEAAGGYNLAGHSGHYNLRAVNRKILGLHSLGEHGVWGWVDGEEQMIQNRGQDKVVFVDAPYLHATHLERAHDLSSERKVPKRARKLKYEIGIEFPRDFYYPEVLFRPRPEIVLSPWRKMSASFYARAFVETPLRKIKRRLFPAKVGY